MRPLRVLARLRGPATGAPMLDGLLAYVVAQRMGLVAGFSPVQPILIPLRLEPLERFHMCSSPIVSWDAHEMRFIHRRFPIAEAQMLSEQALRRVNISAGSCRSYRIPGDVAWAKGDEIAWYCIGHVDEIRDLLIDIPHLGKRRAVGRGAVEEWIVEECVPWGEGFPIVRDGLPMRPLPADWPGLTDPPMAHHTLTYPYYDHTREVLCAVPS